MATEKVKATAVFSNAHLGSKSPDDDAFDYDTGKDPEKLVALGLVEPVKAPAAEGGASAKK